jgi:YD repeat-containing protein
MDLTFEYDRMGRVVRRAAGNVSEYLAYNELDQLASIRRETGQTVSYAYGADGRVSEIFDAQNNRIRLVRDTEGRLHARQLLNPDGSVAQYSDVSRVEDAEEPEHLAAGPVENAASIRPGGKDATLEMRADGIAATLAGSGDIAARFAVNNAGSLTSYTDARGLNSAYTYDDFGRLVRVNSPDSGTTIFRYDAADHLTSKSIAFGTAEVSTVEYKHDPAGRVIEQRTAEGTTRISYGKSGRPEKIVFPAGEERYSYDLEGRLLVHTRVIDGHSFTTNYGYDERGNLVEKTLPDGQLLLYKYHGPMHPKAGLLSSILRRDLFGKTVLLDGLNDADDGYGKQHYLLANAVSYGRELDQRGRIRRIGSPGIWEENHERAENGLLVARNQGNAGAAYAYDQRGRLTGLARISAAPDQLGYGYDAGGNVLARVTGSSRTTYRVGRTTGFLPQ